MSYWQILKPQAGQNLIVNPSFEDGTTTGWTNVDCTSAVSSSWQYRGVYSLEVTPLVNAFAGVYYLSDTLTADTYTYSVVGNFAVGVPYRIRIATTTGTTVATESFTGTGTTQRVSVTAALSAVQYRLFIQKNNDASTDVFYIDAAQLELGGVATTYIDGDQDGCVWDGRPWYSTSSRIVGSTAGGVWQDFEDDLGIIPLEMQGVGMPPLDNVATPYALLPGAQFERSLARSRVFTIVCLIPGSTWANMHALREALIARVQPDQSAQQQPVYLRYTGAADPQVIAAHYDGGLEFAPPTGFAETVPLRFVAHDPFWYSEKNFGIVLTNDNMSWDYLLGYDNNGAWTVLDTTSGGTLNGAVNAIIEDVDGTLIVGGAFTNVDGAGTSYLARYNPADGTWSPMASTSPNNVVNAIYKARNGNIYVGGTFTTIDGITVNRVAEYSGSWSAMGMATVGVNNTVNSITSIDESGAEVIVVTGAFTTAGGVTVNRVAKYEYLIYSWAAFGTGLNSTGNVVVADGLPGYATAFYVGGSFTTASGVTVNRIARWTGSAWQALGTTGVNGTVNAMAMSSDGTLYVGGAFTTAGGVSASYLASWNGIGWTAINHRFTAAVTTLATRGTTLYAAGSQSSPELSTDLWQYIGGSWLPIDNAQVSGTIDVIFWTLRNTLFLGGGGSNYLSYGVAVTVASDGTATAALLITGNGNKGIINFTTRQALYHSAPAAREILIDLTTGAQRIYDPINDTSFAGSIVAGSDMTLRLNPGDNVIAAFVGPIDIYWRPRNWSLDV